MGAIRLALRFAAMIRPSLPVLLLALASLLPTAPAPARAQQINRCVGTDGVVIYTDRRCSDIGAADRRVRAQDAHAARRAYRGCARNLQDLVYEVTSAIDNRDVNRLAGVYHFAGMSHRGGYGVMNRLDAIVRQPLVDIVAVRPEAPVVATAGGTIQPALPDASAAAARRPPVALRLEQTVSDRITPRSTVLNLRRHMGCWWVSL